MSFMTEWADANPDARHPLFGNTKAVEIYTAQLPPSGDYQGRRALSPREEEIMRRLYDFGVLQRKQLAKAFGISIDTVNVILRGRKQAKQLGSKS